MSQNTSRRRNALIEGARASPLLECREMKDTSQMSNSSAINSRRSDSEGDFVVFFANITSNFGDIRSALRKSRR